MTEKRARYSAPPDAGPRVGAPQVDGSGSQLFMLALLEAASTDCTCRTCKLLRRMTQALRAASPDDEED